MLNEQLRDKKQNMKTLLHHRKSLITFLPECDMDNSELIRHITIATKYTKTASLHFERQSLTVREEARFNMKFVEFLEWLTGKMCNDKIDYMLEYLVRVYHVDTYNSEELLFLLLPFRRYGEQIRMLGKNTGSVFGEMRKYSIVFICRAIRDDRRYFRRYSAYFKHYGVLGEFLEKTVDEMAMLLEGRECEHIGELYDSMSYLLQDGHAAAALRMYQRLRKQMETPECLALLREKFTIEEIDGVEIVNSVDIYSEIHLSGGGRELLRGSGYSTDSGNRVSNNSINTVSNAIPTLSGYIKHLENTGKVTSEFTELEMCVLKLLLADNKSTDTDKINCVEIEKLYYEMNGCLRLTEMLIGAPDFYQIYRYADAESVTYIFNNYKRVRSRISDNNISTIGQFEILVDDLLREDNYAVVLRNIRRDVFIKFYEVFLLACLRFTAFDTTFFCQYIPEMRGKSGVRSQNIVALAGKTGYNLLADLAEEDWAEPAYLSYLLRHARGMDETHAAAIIDSVKAQGNSGLVTDANAFIAANPFPRLVFGFLEWRRDDMKSVEPLVERVVKSLDTAFLLDFLVETQNPVVLAELAGRPESGLVKRLYDAKQLRLLFELTKRGHTAAVLNHSHSCVYDFVEKYFMQFTDRDAVASFLIDAFGNTKCDTGTREKTLKMLMADFATLVRFRHHKQWPIAKAILMECLGKNEADPDSKNADTLHTSLILDYVVGSIDKFADDADLFELLVLHAPVDLGTIKKLTTCDSRPAAEFVDIFVAKTTTNFLAVLPFVMPLLLKYASSLKYAHQSLTHLFARYNKLLGPFSAAILRDCPEFSHLLVHVDPRQSLPAIYNSIENNSKIYKLNNADDKANPSTISALESIFNTRTVTSYDLIDKTVTFLSNHTFPSTTYVAFIHFFIESFGAAKNDRVKEFVAYLFTNSFTVFHQIVSRDFVSKNSSIFSTAAGNALEMLYSQDYDKTIEFFADFYTRYNYPLSIPTLDFAKHIYSLHSGFSSLLVSAICTRDQSIVEEFNSYVEEQFVSDPEYALSVLIHLYQNTSAYWVNTKSTRKLSMLHTEDTNPSVSDLAKLLYNILCQEK